MLFREFSGSLQIEAKELENGLAGDRQVSAKTQRHRVAGMEWRCDTVVLVFSSVFLVGMRAEGD